MSKHQIRNTVPYFPEPYIERKANKLLHRYEEEFSCKITSPPIPVEEIADFLLELNLDWEEIDEEDVLAFLKPSTKTITLNSLKRSFFETYFGTEQYTLAHELGHWELHVFNSELSQGSLIEKSPTKTFICRNYRKDRMEFQADIFASYLLMPTNLIKASLEMRSLTWTFLYELRDEYQVSITALRRRLEGLGMLYVTDDGKVFSSKAEAFGQKRLF